MGLHSVLSRNRNILIDEFKQTGMALELLIEPRIMAASSSDLVDVSAQESAADHGRLSNPDT